MGVADVSLAGHWDKVYRTKAPEAMSWHAPHLETSLEWIERAAYVRQVARSLKPGGQLILATFAQEGPERCSGLPTCRYDVAGVAREFGPRFAGLRSEVVEHRTPWGAVQPFLYCQMESSSR